MQTAQALHARCQRAKPKIESVLFIGDQTPEADHEAIKQFTSGRARAFIANDQKGGVGLNLQRIDLGVYPTSTGTQPCKLKQRIVFIALARSDHV